MLYFICVFFYFKKKTAYEWRISDWSSDVALPISRRDDQLRRPPAIVRTRRADPGRDAVQRYPVRAAHRPRLRALLCRDGGARRDDRRSLEPGEADRNRMRRVEIGRASCKDRMC